MGTYYVSVHGRSVLPVQGEAAYEWEIEATPAQAEELKGIMNTMQDKEEEDFLAYVFPWPDTSETSLNVPFQNTVDELYKRIYELGTEETKAQMTASGVYPVSGQRVMKRE